MRTNLPAFLPSYTLPFCHASPGAAGRGKMRGKEFFFGGQDFAKCPTCCRIRHSLSGRAMQHTTAPPYPLYLSLANCHCLVVGFGSVGQRKLGGLLACGPASVLVLDVCPPDAEGQQLLKDARVSFARRACTEEDISGRFLVFAATGDAEENRRIAGLCRTHGILCNSASDPEQGTFHVPAVARHAPLAAALSTSGTSPALARRWKRELELWLVPRAQLAKLLGRLRPLALALPAGKGQNTQLFRKLAASPLQDWLARNDHESCRRYLLEELPPDLHAHITELLHDLS